MPDHTWRHRHVNVENKKRAQEGKKPFPKYKKKGWDQKSQDDGSWKPSDVDYEQMEKALGKKGQLTWPKPKIHPDDIPSEVEHQQEVDKQQAVQDADMEEGAYLKDPEKDYQDLEKINKETGWPEVWLGNFQRFFEAIAPDFSDPKEVSEFYTDLKVGYEGYKFGALAGALAADLLPFPPALTVTSSGTLGSAGTLALNRNQRNIIEDFVRNVIGKTGSGSGKRRPKDWSDITPERPTDVDADNLGEALYSQQWEGISNEIDYDFSKVSTIKTKPRIKSTKGNTMPEWVGTPIVRNAEQFLKDNPTKNLNDFPLTKWDDDYWVPKIRTRSKTVNGKIVKERYIGLDRWDNRKKFDQRGKAERRRMIREQSEGVAPGTRAKEKIRQLNEFNKKRRAVGRRPLNMSEVDIDHVNALKAYDMYTKDLPKKYKDEFKALLANEALTTGDNIGNLKLRETKIHASLWSALKRRLQALGHKYKSYQFRSPEAQMKYYKSINSATGETRIAEFAEAVHYIDEKGTDLMNDLLKPIPKGKKTVRVKKTTKDLLTDILGKGDPEEGAAAYRKFMDELKDVPANVKEEFIIDAIENASN